MPQDSKSRKLDQYIVRFPDGMRQRISDAAKDNNRSMNAEIVSRLADSFARPEKELDVPGLLSKLEYLVRRGTDARADRLAAAYWRSSDLSVYLHRALEELISQKPRAEAPALSFFLEWRERPATSLLDIVVRAIARCSVDALGAAFEAAQRGDYDGALEALGIEERGSPNDPDWQDKDWLLRFIERSTLAAELMVETPAAIPNSVGDAAMPLTQIELEYLRDKKVTKSPK